MAKGIYMTQEGKVFKVTTPEAKKLLKAVIAGKGAVVSIEKEIGPFIDLDTIQPEQATKVFMDIEMASGKEE